MKIHPNSYEAIYCDPEYGPIFGGHDILIANNANPTTNSFSNLGYSYSHPQYTYGQTCAESQFFKEKSSQVIQKSSHDFDFFRNLKKSQKNDFEFF